MRSRGRLGFTLIELLVVIAIIALLIGILLPSLGSARDTAKALKCGTQLKQQGVGLASYMSDNAGWTPPGHRQVNQSAPYIYVWWSLIRQQIDDSNAQAMLFNCPTATEDFWWIPRFDPNYSLLTNPVYRAEMEIYGYREFEVPFRGANVGRVEGHRFTYGYNELGSSDYFRLVGVNPRPRHTHGLGVHAWLPKDGPFGLGTEPRGWGGTPEHMIVFPAEMIAIGDATPGGVDDPYIQPDTRRDQFGQLEQRNPSGRHMGMTEVVWVDGHVTMERRDELVANTFEARSKWNNTHLPHENLWPD